MRTDPAKVRQILLNLLSNAIKFTPEGRVSLRMLPEMDGIRFEVSDTGIGIAPEHHRRIFEPFWQVAQGQTRVVGGTGLGLAVVRELVGKLGGTVVSSLARALAAGSSLGSTRRQAESEK